MDKRITIVLLIGSVLLIGIISAGLLDYFGEISGEIEVKIPIFYLDNIDIMEEKEGYLRFEGDVNGTSFLLDSNKFYSDSLEVEKFYPMNFNIILEVKAFNLPRNSTTGKISESCSIDVKVYQVSESGDSPKKLCETIYLGIDDESDYKKYEFLCNGKYDSEIDFDKGDRIELLLIEQCPNGASSEIKLESKSYIEIIPK